MRRAQKGMPMVSPSEFKLEVLADPDALANRVADWMLDLALAKAGLFSVCLSGGSTPRKLYERLAEAPYRDIFPWARTRWFLGDERFVPHDDPLSNYLMVREALLSHVPVPAANIHPVQTEGISPEAAAGAYEKALKLFYGADSLDPLRPLFDVNLLGLGPDGHTASLFPGSAVLSERDRWAAAVIGVKAEARITLTYPVLESSRHAAFIVSGSEKKSITAQLLRGDDSLPAAHLRPTGKLLMFCDVAAAPDRG
ncbi:MAG: 6-phosphogluconolactonase [Parvibaculaceae bacterium]